MAFTEFCCRSGGSNLNAGTRTGNSTEPGTSADFTYASGNWVQGTGVFTVASGNPSSDGVAVGDFASVYADGSSVTGFVGRVTARDTTTITVSLTAKAGTAPTDGTGNRTLKVGGAWKGSNAAEAFPFGFVANTLTNASSNIPRVNLKNAATYDITAAMTHSNVGGTIFQGYSSSYGDGGRATIDGGTSGASYVLLTVSGGNVILADLIFSNNGASGTAVGLSNTSNPGIILRCVVHDVRGTGFNSTAVVTYIECEAYSCNQSNTSANGGFATNSSPRHFRCISHGNSGSNNQGFRSGNGGVHYLHCVSHGNGSHGFSTTANGNVAVYSHCDIYDNGGDGINAALVHMLYAENCNFLSNGGYGINSSATYDTQVMILNCGFGAGTEANASGATNNANASLQIGTVTYTSNIKPWRDADNGDFTLMSPAALARGRGTYTETASSYSGSVGYPAIGAVVPRRARNRGIMRGGM